MRLLHANTQVVQCGHWPDKQHTMLPNAHQRSVVRQHRVSAQTHAATVATAAAFLRLSTVRFLALRRQDLANSARASARTTPPQASEARL